MTASIDPCIIFVKPIYKLIEPVSSLCHRCVGNQITLECTHVSMSETEARLTALVMMMILHPVLHSILIMGNRCGSPGRRLQLDIFRLFGSLLDENEEFTSPWNNF